MTARETDMHIPESTYRIQFSPAWRFADMHGVLSYLADLGISDIYASPIFAARSGSMHGYDVVDPNALNADLGTAEEFRALTAAARKASLAWLQDIVSNHMAYDSRNHMLMDVFENGAASPFADFFDIEWDHPYAGLNGKVLAPFLGNFYAECLDNGEIKLIFDEDGFAITYHAWRFPLAIESYEEVLSGGIQDLEKRLGADHPDVIGFVGTLGLIKSLPPPEQRDEWVGQVRFFKRMLWDLASASQAVREHLARCVKRYDGKRDDSSALDELDGLLSRQRFRLSFWKVAAEEINYRRFFSINDLISVRMEHRPAFDHAHRLVFELVGGGVIEGVRVDHVDGLFDPPSYLAQLRERIPDAYVVVEKILGDDEDIPASWPIAGTTGYDFLNAVNGVLCERANARRFERIYTAFTGIRTPFPRLVAEKKRLIIGKHMAGTVDNLAHLIKKLSSEDRRGRDFTLYGLRRALVEVMTYFPVYRTYVNERSFCERDAAYIREAVGLARDNNPGLVYELDYIERLLLQSYQPDGAPPGAEAVRFVMQFQQSTGPLMAKGFEDTVLYIYNRLLSLNEVGGNPERFGIDVAAFHQFNMRRAARFPHTMNATATHDTKRGEDVRARINVLSELPDEWDDALRRWRRLNHAKKPRAGLLRAPDRDDEYLFYQTLVGAMPLDGRERESFAARIRDYVIKAVREAKVHTAWIKPDEDYERAFMSFVDRVLAPDNEEFLQDLKAFVERIAHLGMFNSLSQVLLKTASPGVPDFYQGSELWDLSLVDPDNRRPVDYEMRRAALADLRSRSDGDPAALSADLFGRWRDGTIKMFVMHRALQARRSLPELFRFGSYVPLAVEGARSRHALCFMRTHGNEWALAIAARLPARLAPAGELPLGREVWGDTRITLPDEAPRRWRDALTGVVRDVSHELTAADVFAHYPVALLTAAQEE